MILSLFGEATLSIQKMHTIVFYTISGEMSSKNSSNIAVNR
jgi:hypothetical protein